MAHPERPDQARPVTASGDSTDPGGVARRSVLKGAAGAGLAVAAAGVVIDASPAAASRRAPSAHEPVVAHVRNARTGEIEVFSGEHQVTVHDRDLAARLLEIAD